MDTIKRHIGFKEEAPESVTWSDTSFVKAVHPSDQIKHGLGDFALAILCLGLFMMGGLIFAASKDLSNAFESHSRLFFIIIGIAVLGIGLLLSMLRNYLLKRVLTHKINRRMELLFQPDQNCFYVGLENLFTYSDKLKMHAEDYGLLKITASQIQLEMLNHRAQFNLTDLSVSRISTGDDLGCVRLTSSLSTHPWGIAVIPRGLPNKIVNLGTSKDYSHKLYQRLLDAGVRPVANEANVTFLQCTDTIAPMNKT